MFIVIFAKYRIGLTNPDGSTPNARRLLQLPGRKLLQLQQQPDIEPFGEVNFDFFIGEEPETPPPIIQTIVRNNTVVKFINSCNATLLIEQQQQEMQFLADNYEAGIRFSYTYLILSVALYAFIAEYSFEHNNKI